MDLWRVGIGRGDPSAGVLGPGATVGLAWAAPRRAELAGPGLGLLSPWRCWQALQGPGAGRRDRGLQGAHLCLRGRPGWQQGFAGAGVQQTC